MKFKEMIDMLPQSYSVAIQDEDDENVCTTRTDSKGIIPYLDKDVTRWFPEGTLLNPADFTVSLKGV
jgi:hypothetical protein